MSSFHLPNRRDVIDRLRNASDEGIRNNYESILSRVTIEMRSVYTSQNMKDFINGTINLMGVSPLIKPKSMHRWIEEKELGQGTFSTVVRIKDGSEHHYRRVFAFKKYSSDSSLFARREAVFLSHLSIPANSLFIKYYGQCFLDNCLCLRIELMRCTLFDLYSDKRPHNALRSVLRPTPIRNQILINPSTETIKYQLNLRVLRTVASSILSALLLLQKEGIIHADIKPENIFLSWDNPTSSPIGSFEDLPIHFHTKLGDFSNAFHKSEIRFDASADYNLQSLPYRAPEVLFGCPFGSQVDVWSLGVLLIEMCWRRPLFTEEAADKHTELLSSILSVDLKRFIVLTLSPLCSADPFNYAAHLFKIRSMLISSSPIPPTSLTQLIAGLTHPNPDERSTPADGLQNSFISMESPLPICSIMPSTYAAIKTISESGARLRGLAKDNTEAAAGDSCQSSAQNNKIKRLAI